MARRTMVQRLLGDELLELRLMRLPLDARYVWEHLVEIIARRGENGALKLGFELGCELGFAGWFAHWFRRPETEMQTHLETLAVAGLLVLTAEALALPGLSGAAARRAETARANGSKGGRPARKPPEEQASMRLPMGELTIVGKPTETQIVTHTAPAPVGDQLAKLSSLLEEKDKAELAAQTAAETQREPSDAPIDADALADELLQLLGEPMASTNREADRPDRVRSWLELGVTPAAMRQIVRDGVAKPRKPGKDPIGTLSWFDWAMRRAAGGPQLVERRPDPGAEPAEPSAPADPRVAHLPANDRRTAERLLFALHQLESNGGVPFRSPPSGPAYHHASSTRKYFGTAYDAVVRIYPQIAAWFGDTVPDPMEHKEVARG